MKVEGWVVGCGSSGKREELRGLMGENESREGIFRSLAVDYTVLLRRRNKGKHVRSSEIVVCWLDSIYWVGQTVCLVLSKNKRHIFHFHEELY